MTWLSEVASVYLQELTRLFIATVEIVKHLHLYLMKNPANVIPISVKLNESVVGRRDEQELPCMGSKRRFLSSLYLRIWAEVIISNTFFIDEFNYIWACCDLPHNSPCSWIKSRPIKMSQDQFFNPYSLGLGCTVD